MEISLRRLAKTSSAHCFIQQFSNGRLSGFFGCLSGLPRKKLSMEVFLSHQIGYFVMKLFDFVMKFFGPKFSIFRRAGT
ncbi:hypothetical protein L1987_16303 [Smallanthus sonchifolius]|uniref:Uncharacterized protein n=1 Tax=Smallanthus sonchifolius TaxID=185202 RepID=A0ACB9J8I7_9ASTR|nr:hypothetical protein L1987_16303 [Smallanthus sonchifolius]